MSNAVATIQPAQQRSVLIDMAGRYNMEPAAFEATVRATCMPDGGKQQATREEFAAFLLVAREYKLNPLTKEIYAFPRRGGGIVPIVSVDGWVSLVNSHPACDGFDFSYQHDDSGKLISCTCAMHRKDRGRPVIVTEYLAECVRTTEPWKMQHRMLRHKAMIQAARYAFGFSGIYDEDEGAIIAAARDVTARAEGPPAPPPPPPAIPHQPATTVPETTAVSAAVKAAESSVPSPVPTEGSAAPIQVEEFDEAAVLAAIADHCAVVQSLDLLDELLNHHADDLALLSRAGSVQAETEFDKARKRLESAAQSGQTAPAVVQPPEAEQAPAGSVEGLAQVWPAVVPVSADEYERQAAIVLRADTPERAIEWFRLTAPIRDSLAMSEGERLALRARFMAKRKQGEVRS